MIETVQLQVSWAPDVKACVTAEAAETGKSFNDVAVAILAEHFRFPFDGTGRSGSGTRTTSGQAPLRVPPRLWKKVHNAAIPPTTKTGLVDSILREHYGLDLVAA